MRPETDVKWPLKFLFWAHVSLLALIALVLLIGLAWFVIPRLHFGGTDELTALTNAIEQLQKDVKTLQENKKAQPENKQLKELICEVRKLNKNSSNKEKGETTTADAPCSENSSS